MALCAIYLAYNYCQHISEPINKTAHVSIYEYKNYINSKKHS